MTQRKAGIILSYLSIGINSLVALIYVPMLLHYLTKDQYGIYQLMGSLIAYLSIMDFGLSNTTIRYLSQAYAKKDDSLADNVISTSFALYLIIGIVLILVGLLFYGFITPLYGHTLSVTDLETAKKIFLIMLFNIGVTIPAHIFSAVISSHERFIFLKGMNLIKGLLQPLIVWGILAWKASVLNLVLVQTLFALVVITLNILYCKLKLHVHFGVNFHNRSLMKELTGFSVFVFLHILIDQIYWRLGQLVLGAVSGAAAVANYAIAMQLILAYTFIPSTMSGVFLPQLSSIASKITDLTEIDVIFCKLNRLQFILVMLLFIGFVFLGKTFIVLWIGPGYSICYWVALIVMAAYILDVSQNAGNAILQALKKHAFRAYVYVAMALLNICLCIPLGKKYGEIGCAASTAFCLLLGSGLAINWYYWHIGLNLKLLFSNMFSLLKAMIPSILLIYVSFCLIPLQHNWFNFITHGMVLVLIYGLFMWLLGFNQYEKNLFLDPLKEIHRKFLK